jgi:hypothetical protein
LDRLVRHRAPRSPVHGLAVGRPGERTLAAVVLLFAAIAIAALLNVYRVEPPPEAAPVIADSERRTYASTPCVLFNQLDRDVVESRAAVRDPAAPIELKAFANESTIGELRRQGGWRRDATCNAALGFDQIVPAWRRLVGFRSRWADDGHWRW